LCKYKKTSFSGFNFAPFVKAHAFDFQRFNHSGKVMPQFTNCKPFAHGNGCGGCAGIVEGVILAAIFSAPEAQPKIGIAVPENFKPQRGGRKIAVDGSAVPAGLDVIFAHNPQLKLRAIFKRRFAADNSPGVQCSALFGQITLLLSS
jgi:hypothetical protein